MHEIVTSLADLIGRVWGCVKRVRKVALYARLAKRATTVATVEFGKAGGARNGSQCLDLWRKSGEGWCRVVEAFDGNFRIQGYFYETVVRRALVT